MIHIKKIREKNPNHFYYYVNYNDKTFDSYVCRYRLICC